MRAKIVTIAQGKGGSGKTSICMGISAELGVRGFKTLVCDVDSQGSALAWSRAASDDSPFPATVINLAGYDGKVHREIERHVENYDYILVDCAGDLKNLAMQSSILCSNLVLIPCLPAPADMWATCSLTELIRRLEVTCPALQTIILANRVVHTALCRSILAELKNLGLPMMKSVLGNRTAYQQASLFGTYVGRLGPNAHKAAAEVRAITDEMLTLLKEEK